MANRDKNRLSLKGAQSAPTTGPIAQPAAETSAHSQEKIMEAVTEAPAPKTAEAPADRTGPTAREMAAAEEANSLRASKLAEQANTQEVEPVPIAAVAARGYEALHEAFRRHAENNKPKEYVPPPRTPRQMQALEEELEAGRRSQERHAAQQASRPVEPRERNEGFTTPVYRPANMVPDPTIPSASGFAAGTKEFSRDA